MKIARYGAYISRGESLKKPDIYQGVDKITAAKILKVVGGWPVVVNELLEQFSTQNKLVKKQSPNERLDVDTLYQELDDYLWYQLENSNQVYSLPRVLRANLDDIGKLSEFINAFQIKGEYPHEPYRTSIKPYSAIKETLSPQTVELLKNMRLIKEEENIFSIDGLLFSKLLSLNLYA